MTKPPARRFNPGLREPSDAAIFFVAVSTAILITALVACVGLVLLRAFTKPALAPSTSEVRATSALMSTPRSATPAR